MGTDIRESYEGLVDGKRVVNAYRAFAEPDKPYVITLELGDNIISGTFQSMVADADFDADEAADFNRRNTVAWVEQLTELAEKAQAWDDFVDEVTEVEADDYSLYPQEYYIPAGFSTSAVELDQPTAWSVDRLGMDETDSIWTDCEGDRYKYFNDAWHMQINVEDPESWDVVAALANLHLFAPYTTTLADRLPRKVRSLGEAERDAEWIYVDPSGQKSDLRYRWMVTEWVCSRGGDDPWEGVDWDGPILAPDSTSYLLEVITKGSHE